MGFNPTMFDYQRAFAIALSTNNRVGQMMRSGHEIMFQYGTETVLCFKHALTRKSYFLNYQGREVQTMQKVEIINYDRLSKSDPLFLKAIEQIKSLGIHDSQLKQKEVK